MDFFSEFASDEKLEIEGRWVDYNPEIKFKIARSGNKHFGRIFTREYNKNKVLIESKSDAGEEKSNEVMARVFAKTILVGWEGPVKFQGKDYSAYSEDKAFEMLKLKEFRRWVASHAEDFEAYKALQEQDEAKN